MAVSGVNPLRETILLLRSERRYRRLLLASLLSGIGDWFNSVGLLSLLLHLTGSGLAVGTTLALRTLPYLIMGPIGGFLADRMNRKFILLVSDFARAVAALSFLFIRTASDVWIAYIGTLVLVMFSALFSPARTAVIPQLVSSDRVIQANALEQSTFGLVMALGSATGGVVTVTFGTHTAFLINSASFLLSGLICGSIRFPTDHLTMGSPISQTTVSGSAKPESSIRDVLRHSRLVQIIALQSVLWPIGGGVVNVLLSVYGYQVFHCGNLGVGILYGALGVGFLASGFISQHVATWIRQAAVVGFLVEGLGHVFVSQAPGLGLAAIGLAVATVGAGVGNASVTTLVMHSLPKTFHGRVFALFDTTSSVVIAFSMMAAGILLGHVPARMLGLGAGLLIVIASVVTGFPLLRIKLPANAVQGADSSYSSFRQ
jgi:MFS family permease